MCPDCYGKNIDSVAVQHEVLPVRYVLDQRQPGLEPHIALFQLSPHAGLVILTQQPSDHAGSGDAILNSAIALTKPHSWVISHYVLTGESTVAQINQGGLR